MADVVGWLLLGVLLLLLGALILGFWMVLVGFGEIKEQLREIRAQFETSIRLQHKLQQGLTDFTTGVE